MKAVLIQDISKQYITGTVTVNALKSVNLEISEGEFTVFAGPSGSGKTTLLNMLGCMDSPTNGKILVHNKDITGLSDNDASEFRREHIGFIFQHFHLIPVLTVYENVAFALDLLNISTDKKHAMVMEILHDVEIPELEKRRPAELSGGQQQRVSIARALVKNPAFVLADEPTANLDSATGKNILSLMRKLNEKKGITFLFSSHDPEIISTARRVIWLHDGAVQRIESRQS